MSRLRAKLAQHGGPEVIHTVRGAGYALRAPAQGASAEGAPARGAPA